MSQTRTMELLKEIGSGKTMDIVRLAIAKGDAETSAQCQGYIYRDLRNLRRWGDVERSVDGRWRPTKKDRSGD